MIEITFAFDVDRVVPGFLEKVAAIARDPAFLTVWGNAVAKKARENARGKGWTNIARSVQLSNVDPTSRTVTVFSAHVAAAQRHYGGMIEAPGKGEHSRGASMLTIPVGKGKGKTVRDFAPDELFLLVRPNKGKQQAVLARKAPGRKKAIEVLFVLKKRIWQAPNPWWPSDAEAQQIGQRELERQLKKQEEKVNRESGAAD